MSEKVRTEVGHAINCLRLETNGRIVCTFVNFWFSLSTLIIMNI